MTLWPKKLWLKRNLLKLRVTLFDGFFRVEEYNAAGVYANLLIIRIAIIEGKAAIVGGFAYINKLARDIADTATTLLDKTLGFLQKKGASVRKILGVLLTDADDLVADLEDEPSLDTLVAVLHSAVHPLRPGPGGPS